MSIVLFQITGKVQVFFLRQAPSGLSKSFPRLPHIASEMFGGIGAEVARNAINCEGFMAMVPFSKAQELLRSKEYPVFPVDDTESTFGKGFSDQQKKDLEFVPFTMGQLKKCVGTHMLFPTPALTWSEVSEIVREPTLFQGKRMIIPSAESFSNEPAPACWNLMRIEMPASNLPWREKQKLYNQIQRTEQSPPMITLLIAKVLDYLWKDDEILGEVSLHSSEKAPYSGEEKNSSS